MEKVTVQYFQVLIKDKLGYDLELNLDQIFIFEISNQHYIGTSRINPEQGYPSILLGELTENRLVLFPSILPYIRNTTKLTISNETRLVDLSHGKSIAIKSLDGYYLIEDGSNDLIAYGQVVTNRLIPMIDIGIYLRFESR